MRVRVRGDLPPAKTVRVNLLECARCVFRNFVPKYNAKQTGISAGLHPKGLTLVGRRKPVDFCGVCGCIIAGKSLLALPCPLEEESLTTAEEAQRKVKWTGIESASGKEFARIHGKRFPAISG